MELRATPEVFAAFPGLRVAVVTAASVDNSAARPAVDELWAATWRTTAQDASAGGVSLHPRIAPWRERFRALGISPRDYPSSIEALMRRARRAGEPFRINPLVDWYNAISLRHALPAGGFDLDAVGGPLELRLTRAGDSFESLDGAAPEPVAAGEVAYAEGDSVLTRHLVWRQARRALIGGTTRRVLLVSEVLGELPGELAEAVLADLQTGLHDFFGAASSGAILEERSPRFAW